MLIPVSAIIPTYNRINSLKATLVSLAKQNVQFSEVIIVDASTDASAELLVGEGISGLQSLLVFRIADEKGAASQRNEGVAIARQPFIVFMDDDIYLEPYCIERLWRCFEIDASAGGVSSMITNQKYIPIGKFTRLMCTLLEKNKYDSYAGKCIGPAWNFLPSDDASLPEYVEVDWLNTTCTLYRKEALPEPPFPNHFHGYSLMEDLTLSLTVRKSWKLYNARTARIVHDSQPGSHKNNFRELNKMSSINRYYVMTKVMGKTSLRDKLGLFLYELFQLTSMLVSKGGLKKTPALIIAKLSAIVEIRKTIR